MYSYDSIGWSIGFTHSILLYTWKDIPPHTIRIVNSGAHTISHVSCFDGSLLHSMLYVLFDNIMMQIFFIPIRPFTNLPVHTCDLKIKDVKQDEQQSVSARRTDSSGEWIMHAEKSDVEYTEEMKFDVWPQEFRIRAQEVFAELNLNLFCKSWGLSLSELQGFLLGKSDYIYERNKFNFICLYYRRTPVSYQCYIFVMHQCNI